VSRPQLLELGDTVVAVNDQVKVWPVVLVTTTVGPVKRYRQARLNRRFWAAAHQSPTWGRYGNLGLKTLRRYSWVISSNWHETDAFDPFLGVCGQPDQQQFLNGRTDVQILRYDNESRT
jgi:hypothetical protein